MFATPLGLLALLAIPAIVAIHLFRRRFPVRPVAGLFLWQLVRQTPEDGGKIAKLPITTSLILECLAALALALILAGARMSSAGVSPHLVVLLDDSASMAAVNARGESARDRAVRRVLAELDRLGSRRARHARPERRSPVGACRPGRARRRSAARAGRVETGRAASFARARHCGWRASSPGATGRLMVMSDVAPASRGEANFEGALWVSVGEPLANVGITAAERTLVARRRPRHGVADARQTIPSAPARRRLSVSAGDKDVLDQGSRRAARRLLAHAPASRRVCRRCASRCPTMR